MSLLVTGQRTEAGPSVEIHPLVLLTITDSLSRYQHRQHDEPRQKQAPIAGAILGHQEDRIITFNVAFEAKVNVSESGLAEFDHAWFSERLQQYKEVHKSPALDLVGWWATCPASGPQIAHVPLHRYVLENYNETAIVLALHPSRLTEIQQFEGALPFSVYESLSQNELRGRANPGAEDIQMAEDPSGSHKSDLKFRRLSYAIDTDEVEMIVLDSIARDAIVVTPAQGNVPIRTGSEVETGESKGYSTGKAETHSGDDGLSTADEQLIQTLTARANAVRMLSGRIAKIKAFLDAQPSSYLRDATVEQEDKAEPLEHVHLRNIQALLIRLPLLLPPTREAAFFKASQKEAAGISQLELLGCLGLSIRQAGDLGRKFAAIETMRNRKTGQEMSARQIDEGPLRHSMQT